MTKRQWKSKEKSLIILSHLKGKSVSEICNEHGISQTTFYKWRDQFLGECHTAFEPKTDHRSTHLEKENQKLKSLIGELTLELKKIEL